MANAIIKALFKLLMKLVVIVLTPLDLLIKNLLPDLSNVLAKVNSFFDLLIDYASFGVSYLGLTTETLSIITLLLTLILTIPLAVHVIKLAIKWYNALMP